MADPNLRFRITVFGTGALLGAAVAWFLVDGHRKATELERTEQLAPLDTTLEPSIQEAIIGIKTHYERTASPIQNRLLESERFFKTEIPGKLRRVLILQGREPQQRLRVEERLQMEDGAPDVLIPSAQQLARSRVTGWRITHPGRVDAKPANGVTTVKITNELSPLGILPIRRSKDTGQITLQLPGDGLEDVDKAIKQLAESTLFTTVQPHFLDGLQSTGSTRTQ